jgi:arylsulfatase A-like enzyme
LRGTRDKPVSNIDVTAAFVELSGATAGRTLDGTSVLPLLADPNAPWNTATLLQCVTTIGLATQHYRYCEWPATGERELYDLTKDPYELQNFAGAADYAKIQHQMAKALRALEGCTGDTCQWTGKFPHPPRG